MLQARYADYKNCNAVSPACPLSATTYGYVPNLAASVGFVVIFGLCCVLQLALGVRYKTYPYMIAAVIGMFGETVGYGGRIIMHKNAWSTPGFEMQICCLVLAPSFLAACIYLTLKHVTRYCGEQYSRLKPKWYTWYFIGGDFGSIVLQAIGGGTAAAGGHQHPKVANVGDHIIVAGIAFQLVVMSIAACLIGEFYWRLKHNKPFVKAKVASSQGSATNRSEEEKGAGQDVAEETAMAQVSGGPGVDTKFKIFIAAIAFGFITIYIRCIYRIPEMAGGWGGPVMRKEKEFYLLDGMMCALASIAFTAFHPAFLFTPMKKGWEA